MTAYYNEIEPYAADWLENLIAAGLIPYGYVDRRSIRDVQPGDLRGYSQHHFFAGIGGWAYAARLARWPDSRPLWTGSCPCQPFSVAGKGKGAADDRHLWPEFYRLIDACRPACVFGEQVAGKAGLSWFDGVRSDLESSGYAARGFVVPACAVNAPHRRERLWFVAEPEAQRRDERRAERTAFGRELSTYGASAPYGAGELADTPELAKREPHNENGADARERARTSFSRAGAFDGRAMGDASCIERPEREGFRGDVRKERAAVTGSSNGFWDGAEWLECADGKSRRLKPGLALLANGVPRDVAGMLAGFGNAIVPQVAAEILAAYLETR